MPAALIQRTTPTPTPPEANGEAGPEPPEAEGRLAHPGLEDPADGDGQGRGEPNGSSRRPPRRRPKPASGEKTSARKLTLPDSVYIRLELQAIRRGATASAIAAEILDRYLPRHRIVTDD
jgi:hypothetical protein